MPTLILIKHAMPEINPETPASQWRLSDVGRRQCAPLAQQIARYAPDLVVASVEPKATETGRLLADQLGLAFSTHEGLHEHDRSNLRWSSTEQFEAQVARFFQQPTELVMGEETADAAHSRFAAAIADVVAGHPDSTTAVVAHGTVITLLVARAVGMEAFSLWKKLELPSFVVFSLPAMQLVTVVGNAGADRPSEASN